MKSGGSEQRIRLRALEKAEISGKIQFNGEAVRQFSGDVAVPQTERQRRIDGTGVDCGVCFRFSELRCPPGPHGGGKRRRKRTFSRRAQGVPQDRVHEACRHAVLFRVFHNVHRDVDGGFSRDRRLEQRLGQCAERDHFQFRFDSAGNGV